MKLQRLLKSTVAAAAVTTLLGGGLLAGPATAAPATTAPAKTAPATAEGVNPYIVGGGFVEEEAPWIAALHNNGSFTCTASIISAEWILTASHCVEGGGDFTVRIGSLQRSSGGTEAHVGNVVMHPEYSWPNNDIALLQLDTPVETEYAPLADEADIADGQAATLYGWGSENPDWSGPLPEDLKFANGTIESKECDAADPAPLCTATDGSVAGGDSGGPVWVESAEDGQWVQAGVCAIGHQPAGDGWAGYTSTGKTRDWIREVSGV